MFVLERHNTRKAENGKGENKMTKYNGKPAKLSFKKLVELIADVRTEDEWNEAYALTEWNAQQDPATISHKDEALLIHLLERVVPEI